MSENPARQFADKTVAALRNDTFVRLVLSGVGKSPAHRVLGRCVLLRGEPHLSLTIRAQTRDVAKNLPVNAVAAWLGEWLGSKCHSALLSTTRADWQFSVSPSGRPRLIRHRAAICQPPPRQHDQPKQTLLDHSAQDWLRALGVCGENGQVRSGMADKHRQIHRYLEILSHCLDPGLWRTADGSSSGELVIADMGSGKGYLTFGAWHLLRRVRGWPARVIGVEVRADLVETCRRAAAEIRAEGIEFQPGTIQHTQLSRVDVLIALHACDTATDAAIGQGIRAGARLILVAPCCHQEVRPQLRSPPVLAPILAHGIMEARLAEWLTDGLRALYLEAAGYRTKLFEFVASEHTPKNLMLAATLEKSSRAAREEARGRIAALKQFFGIEHHALDGMLEAGS